jgi:hypothetical protein
LLTPEIFDKYESCLYEDNNPFEKQNLVALLANYFNYAGDEFTDIKDSIASLAEELPVLKFALNPLACADFEIIDYKWMAYVTEDLYEDIIKDEVARKKLKEYCESVSWGKEIKEIIWKKL